MAQDDLVDGRLGLAPALEAHPTVVKVGEAVVDVGVQGLGCEPLEWRLGRVVVEGALAGVEDLAPAPGGVGERVAVARTRERPGRREHDGLEEVQRPEGARSRLLGQQQAGAATRVAHSEGSRQPHTVHRRQRVAREAVPVEVHLRGHAGVAVTPQVN